MLVHLVKAIEQGMEVVWPDGQHGRQSDGRVHGVAPANPVPEAEHVRCVDAEFGHPFAVRRDGDKVLRHRRLVSTEAGH